jgi:hypothetical protein
MRLRAQWRDTFTLRSSLRPVVGMRLRAQWRDTFERRGLFLADSSDVVHVLEIEPIFGRIAEVFNESERGGRRDAQAVLIGEISSILRRMRICGFEKGLNYKILIAA